MKSLADKRSKPIVPNMQFNIYQIAEHLSKYMGWHRDEIIKILELMKP